MNEETTPRVISLGKSPKTEEDITLPIKALKKHIAIFGQSGSGKTVACKIVIEEAVRNNIPAIIIDPQGDISSLALVAEWEKLEKYGISKEFYEQYKDKIEAVIFTPASEKGIPLSINPLIIPPEELDREEKILALDGMATNLVDVLGYKLGSNKGKAVKAYLTALFQAFMEKNILVQDFQMLMDLIQSDDAYLPESYRTLLSSKDKDNLINNIKFLTVGAQSLVFNLGPKVSIPTLMHPSQEGKVRISIIYLNTLTTQKLKNLYISTVSQRLYTYMLSNPSHEPQLIFYIDELAGLIPPYPRNPPTKKWLQLLFKQGRKYGVSMLVATQNVSDVDYKAFGQVSTFFFGRFMAPQDLRTVEKMIQSHPSARFILEDLPTFEPGEFYLLSPDNYKLPVRFKTRWLYSAHRALSDDDVSKLYKNPPPSLCKVVGDYDYDVDTLDFADVEKELSLDDIEKELSKLHQFATTESLLDSNIDLEDLDDFPIPDSSELSVGKEITQQDFTTVSEIELKEPKVKQIDLTKLLKTIKKQYLKYEAVDFKDLLTKFFGEKKFSYLG
ncbi:MAG: ATP-binding protein, partial [Candidatus Heimdallarchaeaceae archaeon]